MSLTSMLLNRQVPTFREGLPRYINRPDTSRRPFVVSTKLEPEPVEESTPLQDGRKVCGAASIAQSRHAILDAIKSGAKTKPEIQAKSRLSKSSVFNHVRSMVKDGILMIDKSVSPWVVEVTR